jgi:hypothetical protein
MLKNQLERLLGKSSLVDAVVNHVLDGYTTDEEIKNFFEDLMQHGCQSGMVGELIYYTDTHKFFNDHYEEIEELREEYEDSTGEALRPKGDMKNWFAWFAFEQTAYNIATDLEII